mmetsp:Transcript_34580/g.99268  ORF Transcript_34580/g.99268 Transcript_34580/m.99268 type:complete len:203 (+) Transcript_34580:1597-2205(+)
MEWTQVWHVNAVDSPEQIAMLVVQYRVVVLQLAEELPEARVGLEHLRLLAVQLPVAVVQAHEQLLELAVATKHLRVLVVQARVALLHREQQLLELAVGLEQVAVLAVEAGVAVLHAEQQLLQLGVLLAKAVHLREHGTDVRWLQLDTGNRIEQWILVRLFRNLHEHTEILHDLHVPLALEHLLLHCAQALGDELRAGQQAPG